MFFLHLFSLTKDACLFYVISFPLCPFTSASYRRDAIASILQSVHDVSGSGAYDMRYSRNQLSKDCKPKARQAEVQAWYAIGDICYDFGVNNA